MRTLGIDLASQANKTALCVIDWGQDDVCVSAPVLGVADADIVKTARDCDAVGIDAPFGWPQPFVELVGGDLTGSKSVPGWTNGYRDSLRFRLTDFRAMEVLGRWPLSVSSDRIAITAMRCAGLLAQLDVLSRSGNDRVYEVYPAAALCAWDLPSRQYKSDLESMMLKLVIRCPWLNISDEARRVCITSDHAFDALVSSLVARAASLQLTTCPSGAEVERAEIEGWIAIPRPDSLAKLFSPSAN